MRTDVNIAMPTLGNAKAEVLSETLKKQAKEQKRLKGAAQEFESLLLETMVKEMRATVPKSKLMGSEDQGKDLFNEMLDGEFVRLMSSRGGIGLADFLANNLNDPHLRK